MPSPLFSEPPASYFPVGRYNEYDASTSVWPACQPSATGVTMVSVYARPESTSRLLSWSRFRIAGSTTTPPRFAPTTFLCVTHDTRKPLSEVVRLPLPDPTGSPFASVRVSVG